MPQSTLEKAILKTLIYADLFDYPLTEEEVWKRLIEFRIQNSEFRMRQRHLGWWQSSDSDSSKVEGTKYFFLKGRQHIVSIRQKRKKYSQEKLKIAERIADLLRFIPTIRLIGVTGALAVSNAEEEDDIDLIIVATRALLWTTRFLATLLVGATGRRRHPGEQQVKDKICLNMFIDERHLEIPKRERDLFTAYEIVQMKPIFERDNVYQNFLKANQWVKKYLPNSISKQLGLRHRLASQGDAFYNFYKYFFIVLEKLLKFSQLYYMRKRRTNEVIKESIIRFHPKDAREWVLKKYMKKLREHQILD